MHNIALYCAIFQVVQIMQYWCQNMKVLIADVNAQNHDAATVLSNEHIAHAYCYKLIQRGSCHCSKCTYSDATGRLGTGWPAQLRNQVKLTIAVCQGKVSIMILRLWPHNQLKAAALLRQGPYLQFKTSFTRQVEIKIIKFNLFLFL